MNKKILQILTILVSLIGITITIISQDWAGLMTIIGLVLITFKLKITRYYAILAYGVYVLLAILSGQFSILSFLIWGIITQRLYNEWNSSENTINLVHLDELSAKIFSRFLIMMIALNAIMIFMISGFNLASVLSFPVLYSILSSSLQFLAVYMIAQRMYEASYFYLGFLVLEIIMIMMVAISGLIPVVFMLNLGVIIIQILITTLFIIKNR